MFAAAIQGTWGRSRGIRVFAAVLAIQAVPGVAGAQEGYDEFSVERFDLSLDGDGILDVDTGRVGEHLGWNTAAWVTGVDEPLVLTRMSDGSEAGALVATRVVAGVGGSVGLWRRVQLGFSVPVVVFQRSSVSAAEMPVGLEPLPAAGIGDVRFVPKVRLVDRADGLQVAVLLAVTVPPGAPGGYLREAGPTLAPELAVSSLLGPVHLAIDVGYRLRSDVHIADRVAGDEVFLRAGAGYRLGDRYQSSSEIALTVSAAAPARGAFSPDENVFGVLLGGKQAVGPVELVLAGGAGVGRGLGNPDWRALAAVRWRDRRGDLDHDGFLDRADRCPGRAEDLDGFEDTDGCPDLDDDGDGVPDRVDKAPLLAEDPDGFEDGDGAPDPDNDQDGVADVSDRCPLAPESKNGTEDDDGCPEALTAALTVRVVDPNGAGIPGASVRLSWPGGTRDLQADQTGAVETVTLDGPQDDVVLSASATGYQDRQQRAKVPQAHQPLPVVVTLDPVPRGTIRGFVRGYDGKAVRASVRLKPGDLEARADAEGFFEIDVPSGSYDVTIEARGFTGQTRTVRVTEDGVTLLNVDLRKERDK